MKKIVLLSFIFSFFYACNSKNEPDELQRHPSHLTEAERSELLDEARQIALNSQQVLGGQLMEKLQENGSLGALDFCSVNAIQITDDLSKTHETKIKRVTDKPRNQDNKANPSQLDYIDLVKNQLKNKNEVNGALVINGNSAQAYFPIISNTMCLQCHGVPGEDISDPTFAKINELYPDDKAIEYKENEVRGIWVVDVLLNK